MHDSPPVGGSDRAAFIAVRRGLTVARGRRRSGAWGLRGTAAPVLACACALATIAACGHPDHDGAPRRIVSLDYCADQYVLAFAAREDIVALSPDARAPFSYQRADAEGMPTVLPRAEEVLALRPTHVVRAYGGGPGVAALMRRLGVDVVEIGYVAHLEEIAPTVQAVGSALGAADKATATAEAFQERLRAVAQDSDPDARARVLYLTSGGYTTGPGTLIDEMIRAAGRENFMDEPGWREVPLERLMRSTPDRVAASFFEQAGDYNAWSAARHPVVGRLLSDAPTTRLDGAWTACGGWFLIEAIEALSHED